MAVNLTYYEILNVLPQASQEEIRKAYRKAARKTHPDLEDGNPALFRLIQEAFEVLDNPVTRTRYDQTLTETYGPHISDDVPPTPPKPRPAWADPTPEQKAADDAAAAKHAMDARQAEEQINEERRKRGAAHAEKVAYDQKTKTLSQQYGHKYQKYFEWQVPEETITKIWEWDRKAKSILIWGGIAVEILVAIIVISSSPGGPTNPIWTGVVNGFWMWLVALLILIGQSIFRSRLRAYRQQKYKTK